MDIGEKIKEALNPYVVFKIPYLHIPVTDTVVVMWIIMAVIMVFAVILTRNLKAVPEGKQNIAEIIVNFIDNFSTGAIGHRGRLFMPYLGTLIIFLLISNMISVVNVLPFEFLYNITGIDFFRHLPQLRPPTKDANTTAALAVMTSFFTIYQAVRIKKLTGWLGDFVKPSPIMLPFKIMDLFIRPVSLCFRLFGNIMGAFILMEMIYLAEPLILPAALSVYFDLFDGILQAYIFTLLSSLYIAEAVE